MKSAMEKSPWKMSGENLCRKISMEKPPRKNPFRKILMKKSPRKNPFIKTSVKKSPRIFHRAARFQKLQHLLHAMFNVVLAGAHG